MLDPRIVEGATYPATADNWEGWLEAGARDERAMIVAMIDRLAEDHPLCRATCAPEMAEAILYVHGLYESGDSQWTNQVLWEVADKLKAIGASDV